MARIKRYDAIQRVSATPSLFDVLRRGMANNEALKELTALIHEYKTQKVLQCDAHVNKKASSPAVNYLAMA